MRNPSITMKEIYREKDVVGNISSIQFSCLSSEAMQQLSHFQVVDPVCYEAVDRGKPNPLGPLSRKMVSHSLLYYGCALIKTDSSSDTRERLRLNQ